MGSVKNPIEKYGGIILSESEKYVDVFFDSPLTKSSSFINNTYTYNDENVIVKYYPNGVLEYVKYKSNIGVTNEESPYNIAIQFLAKDTNIKNDFNLKDFKVEDNKTVFYFDYKINNFPITLSQAKMEELEMQSIIEVTVEDNRVSKYKRLIYDFYIEEDYTTVEKNFIDTIDTILVNTNNKDTFIDEMKLVYKFENPNEFLNIQWFVSIDDKSYFEDVAYGG